jgi:hypothetical protein
VLAFSERMRMMEKPPRMRVKQRRVRKARRIFVCKERLAIDILVQPRQWWRAG